MCVRNTLIKFLWVLLVGLTSSQAMAVNCQRATTPLENTICSNDGLHWLDTTMTIIYRAMLVKEDSLKVHSQYENWENRSKSAPAIIVSSALIMRVSAPFLMPILTSNGMGSGGISARVI